MHLTPGLFCVLTIGSTLNYDVAHIREQSIDLVITLVDSSFGIKLHEQQESITNALQKCAGVAGLAGVVVPVWDAGNGKMGFFAPPNFQAYFSSINLDFVIANVNRKLTCL